ncbi:MAG: NifB/NifX family molybdenum-iron cluster-binding protein [Candidatus Ancaeobacter aquaticus]|nr:NifB/NifX family molybdenum-iron cluster-binding protein [Candidatus Ancaeobacter aquaticus]
MKIGITLDDDKGLESNVSLHFGQCKYFLIVDVENNEIKNATVSANTAVHGGAGCIAVDEILKHDVTHVIAGGMGMGAQNKFAQAGVNIFACSGRAKDAVEALLKDALGGIDACQDHGECS